MHFSSLTTIFPIKKPALSIAPVGQTLLEGQNGDLSHFASIINAFFPFFDFFSVFNYVPPSIIGSIIYHIGVYVNNYCVSTLKQILYNMIKRSIAFF